MKFGIFKISLLVLSLCAPSLCAQHWSTGASSAQADRCNFSSERFGQRYIVADFNNDQKPDSITLISLGQHGGQNLFGVRLCDSARPVRLLTFESSEPSVIVTAIDLNQDGSPDIVVEQSFTQRRIEVWLNDGRGGFQKARVADFAIPDTRAPCSAGMPLKERGNFPPRAHLRRGKKLGMETAKLPTICCYSPNRYRRSLTAQVQKELGGPNLSRAPPLPIQI